MLGAIVGDIVGSVYEFGPGPPDGFELFAARAGFTDDTVHCVAVAKWATSRMGYDCSATLDDRRPHHRMDETCQGTVPVALTAVFESRDFESAVRNAVAMGGDADTLECIAGAVAEALYGGVPPSIRDTALARLTPDVREVVDRFVARYPVPLA